MPRLKSRDRFIPGGFQFRQPETNFQAPQMASFETIVQALIAHRKANPHLVSTHGWSIDPNQVREELDSYNARLCKQMGWADYFYEGPGQETPMNPKSMPPPSHAAKLVAGADTLVEWLGEGGKVVEPALAEKRANVCVTCPNNSKLDISTWFTNAVSAAIRMELGHKNEMKLSVTNEDKLGTCEVCACPMRLKVWTPLEYILKHQPEGIMEQLPVFCWIKKKDQ